jgi:hypothetical protein
LNAAELPSMASATFVPKGRLVLPTVIADAH